MAGGKTGGQLTSRASRRDAEDVPRLRGADDYTALNTVKTPELNTSKW